LGLSQPSLSSDHTNNYSTSRTSYVAVHLLFHWTVPTLEAQKTAFMNIAGFPGALIFVV